jgi:hypothetical protein
MTILVLFFIVPRTQCLHYHAQWKVQRSVPWGKWRGGRVATRGNAECRSQNAEWAGIGPVSRRAPRMRARRPRSQGRRPAASPGTCRDCRVWAHCIHHAWRCARPRARSLEGDGTVRLRQLSANGVPGCGRDARAPKGGGPPRLQARVAIAVAGRTAYPTVGDAPGLGRGAWRATGRFAYASRRPTGSPDAGGTPALPREEGRRVSRGVSRLPMTALDECCLHP